MVHRFDSVLDSEKNNRKRCWVEEKDFKDEHGLGGTRSDSAGTLEWSLSKTWGEKVNHHSSSFPTLHQQFELVDCFLVFTGNFSKIQAWLLPSVLETRKQSQTRVSYCLTVSFPGKSWMMEEKDSCWKMPQGELKSSSWQVSFPGWLVTPFANEATLKSWWGFLSCWWHSY